MAKLARARTAAEEDDFDDYSHGQLLVDDPSGPTRRLVKEYVNALRSELEPRFDAVDERFLGVAEATKVLNESNTRVPTLLQTATAEQMKLFDSKLEKRDGDITQLQEHLRQRSPDIKEAVGHLKELVFAEITGRDNVDAEIFKRIETQFVERDKRTEQLALASSTAIAAALQAQKEAAGATTDSILAVITKMDASFTKLFDQMQIALQSMQSNIDDKIDDLKGRFDKREGSTGERDPRMDAALSRIEIALANGKTVDDKRAGNADTWKNIVAIGALVISGVIAYASLHHG